MIGTRNAFKSFRLFITHRDAAAFATAFLCTRPIMTSYIDNTRAPAPTASRPTFDAPAGACDCHCHVFGPYDRFPLAAERTYGPPQAPAEAYIAMLDTLGFDRGVLVQASAHGMDNSAMLHAIRAFPDRLRGVAVMPGNTSAKILADLYQRGVRGLRFSRLLLPDGTPRYKNAVDISEMEGLLSAMRELGMHVQLWIGLDQIAELEPIIRRAGVPMVIDHMGRFEPSIGTGDARFARLCQLVGEGLLWVKMTPYRCSTRFPDYPDVRPFHEALLAANPDRLVWGSDWPHINMSKDIPDPGHLVDLFAQWTSNPALIRKILVDNPATLYGF